MDLKNEYIESLKKIPNLDIEKLLLSYEKPAYAGIRFNTKKINKLQLNKENFEKTMQDLCLNIDFEPILWCDNGFYAKKEEKLGKNILHEMGLYYLQEPSAMSPVEFLRINESDTILDLCASPGGKSTQIANKLESGFLVSNEIVPKRARVLAENIERLGVPNAIVTNHSPKELEQKFENFFDKILVDAPCSGEGMFRKNDEAIDEWTTDTPQICATRQKEIVKSAYKMLKPNGILVYSTCTFSLEENEEVIKFLLDTFDDMEILPVEHKQFNFDCGIDLDGTKRLTNCVRLYPYNIKGEGHFFAVLHKKDLENNTELTKKIKKSNKKEQKNQNTSKKIKIFEEFFKKHSELQFTNYELLGENLYANCPINIDGIKVETCGMLLGEFKKDAFIPSMHLARYLNINDFDECVELDEIDTLKYIEGLEIPTSHKDGFVLLLHKGYSIDIAKCVNGKIKNHYPKYLRKKL